MDILNWESIREKWTVITAIIIMAVAFTVVIVILIYVIYKNDYTLLDKILTLFSAFIMAVLGYLFGYVPTKASEEAAKKDKEQIEKQMNNLNQAVDEFRVLLDSKEKTIKEYEGIISLFESE